MSSAHGILVEVSAGELIDKITILEIKAARITDKQKRENVCLELAVLRRARDAAIGASHELESLTGELKAVNEALWQIEDEIRECECKRDFGPSFVELARRVYHSNDRRAALKRQINHLLGCRLVEEKAYSAY